MKYKAIIEHVETGDSVEFEGEWEDMHDLFLIWSEGNFSCDCNRESFFLRTRGIEPDPAIDCSDGRYRVPYLVLEDGSKMDIDDE